MMFPKPEKKVKEKKTLRRLGKGSLTKAKKKAWDAFSLWVRLSNADPEGWVKCFTCGVPYHYKNIQAGHFIPGRRNAVLFSVPGVHPQCQACNVFMHGNWPAYYERMVELYGLETVNELLRKRNEIVKYTVADYEAIEERYKQKISEL